MDKVICGPCKKEFKTNEEFLAHECEAAGGAKPTEQEYVIRTTCPNFAKISEASIKRGDAKGKKAKK